MISNIRYILVFQPWYYESYRTTQAYFRSSYTGHPRKNFFAQYPEHPSPKIYGEEADKEGRVWFQAMVGKNFEELKQENNSGWVGDEESPYLQEALNIKYPTQSVPQYIENAQSAFDSWRKVSVEERASLLIESLERMKKRFQRGKGPKLIAIKSLECNFNSREIAQWV